MAGEQLKKKYRINGLSPKQQKWLQDYEASTMLEPLGLDEMAKKPESFDGWAKYNIERFESFASEAFHRINVDVPYIDSDFGWKELPRCPECGMVHDPGGNTCCSL